MVSNSGPAWLGITVRPFYDAKFQPAGAGVVSATPGGPAAEGGIRPGDIIVSVSTTRITTVGSLTAALASLLPGEQVEVGLVRNDADIAVELTLGEEDQAS